MKTCAKHASASLLTLFALGILPGCGGAQHSVLITGPQLASAFRANGVSARVLPLAELRPHDAVAHLIRIAHLRPAEVTAVVVGAHGGLVAYVTDSTRHASRLIHPLEGQMTTVEQAVWRIRN